MIGCPAKDINTYYYSFVNRKDDEERQSNYSWCPIPLRIKNEAGTTLKFKDETFQEYFEKVEKWSYCFDIPDYYEKDIPLDIKHFVVNRYNKYLGGMIYCFIRDPCWESGDFIFLPCPTKITDIEAINFILEKHFLIYQETPVPEWAESIKLPGLDDIGKKIEMNSRQIEKISEQKSQLERKASDLKDYKKLLYETGSALEKIVRKVFNEFGYEPKPPLYGEEYVIEFNSKIGVIEVKGNKKSIKRDDFRQILDYLKEYELKDLGKYKGILIGNAWRLKPVDERDTKVTPIFPDNVMDIASKHGIALLSTIDLFDIFCKFLEEKISGKDIMKNIFDAKGVVNFDV